MSLIKAEITSTQERQLAWFWRNVLGEDMVKKECKTCMGHGLWFDGSNAPMGPMDAEDGIPTLPCPECGANANPTGKTKPKGITDEEFIKDISKMGKI